MGDAMTSGRSGRSDLFEITCPRCHDVSTVRHYGPCDACRSQLRARLGGPPRRVDTAEYVPKMNVTPGAVATKD
ncbi:MAG: hypothetical protein ACE5GB_07415 [Acidimicrobiales bacterium]